jgi:hypothetical protein
MPLVTEPVVAFNMAAKAALLVRAAAIAAFAIALAGIIAAHFAHNDRLAAAFGSGLFLSAVAAVAADAVGAWVRASEQKHRTRRSGTGGIA